MVSSGMLRRVALVRTDVSEGFSASFPRVKTSNLRYRFSFVLGRFSVRVQFVLNEGPCRLPPSLQAKVAILSIFVCLILTYFFVQMSRPQIWTIKLEGVFSHHCSYYLTISLLFPSHETVSLPWNAGNSTKFYLLFLLVGDGFWNRE
jgi:hypothetical protein